MQITQITNPAGSTVLVKLGTDQFGNAYSKDEVEQLSLDLQVAFPDTEIVITRLNIESLSVVALG